MVILGYLRPSLFFLPSEVVIITKKRSKYNVDTTKKGKQNRTYNGITYDSDMEMRFYRDVIHVGLQDGTIKKCERQVTYELQPKFTYNGSTVLPIHYKADFVITYADGSVIVWDVKGLADAVAKIKKKMFHYRYPDIDYRWISESKIDGGWLDYKELEAKRKQRKKAKKKEKIKPD